MGIFDLFKKKDKRPLTTTTKVDVPAAAIAAALAAETAEADAAGRVDPAPIAPTRQIDAVRAEDIAAGQDDADGESAS